VQNVFATNQLFVDRKKIVTLQSKDCEVRLRLGIKNKQVCFILLSTCTNFAFEELITIAEMSNTVSLEQSTMRAVVSLFGNEEALKKLRSLAKSLKKAAKKDDSNVMTAADKKRILADIKQGLIEVEMAKRGEIRLQTWEEVKHELCH